MSYQPKTGARCTCKRGQQRDNCANCEGTGWVIDFAAIRARRLPPAIGVRLDPKTGQYFPTVDGIDVSPSSFDEQRALDIARQTALKHTAKVEAGL